MGHAGGVALDLLRGYKNGSRNVVAADCERAIEDVIALRVDAQNQRERANENGKEGCRIDARLKNVSEAARIVTNLARHPLFVDQHELPAWAGAIEQLQAIIQNRPVAPEVPAEVDEDTLHGRGIADLLHELKQIADSGVGATEVLVTTNDGDCEEAEASEVIEAAIIEIRALRAKLEGK